MNQDDMLSFCGIKDINDPLGTASPPIQAVPFSMILFNTLLQSSYEEDAINYIKRLPLSRVSNVIHVPLNSVSAEMGSRCSKLRKQTLIVHI